MTVWLSPWTQWQKSNGGGGRGGTVRHAHEHYNEQSTRALISIIIYQRSSEGPRRPCISQSCPKHPLFSHFWPRKSFICKKYIRLWVCACMFALLCVSPRTFGCAKASIKRTRCSEKRKTVPALEMSSALMFFKRISAVCFGMIKLQKNAVIDIIFGLQWPTMLA